MWVAIEEGVCAEGFEGDGSTLLFYCKGIPVSGTKGIREAPRELYWGNAFRGALGSVGSTMDPRKPSVKKTPPWLLYIIYIIRQGRSCRSTQAVWGAWTDLPSRYSLLEF